MYIKSGHHVNYSPIGIDIGTRSINIVQLASSTSGLSMHEADIMMLPDDNIGEGTILPDVLAKVLKQDNFRGKEVVTRMPPSFVSIIPVKISLRDNETIEQAILRESKEYIPYPVEEAVIDYLPVSSVTEGSDEARKVLLIFTKRSDVVNYLNIFKKVGLKVKAIDIGPNAINRAIKKFRDPSERRILVLNIGNLNSFSTILWDDMILIDRKMGWGENNITEKMVSNLDIDIYEARKFMHRYGVDWSSAPRIMIDDDTCIMPDEDIPAHLYEIVSPALEELNKEIEKILIYCTSEMKGAMIDQIYMIGGGGFMKHLNAYIHKSFGIGVKPFDPELMFSQVETLKDTVKDNFPIFIIAIGLALRGFDTQCPIMN